MDVLVLLAQRQGEVVHTNEIVAVVWNSRPMGDNPVYKCIAKLRKALKDHADDAAYIITVPTKGYKLEMPVRQPQYYPVNKQYTIKAAHIKKPILLVIAGIIVGLIAAVLFISPTVIEPLQPKIFSTFPGSHSAASFSPDGKRVVFVSGSQGEQHLYQSSIKKAQVKQLTFDTHHDERPRWSPVANEVLFARDNAIWLLSLDTGQSRQLIANGQNASWSLDGKKIVFERRFQIWTANADGGNQFRVNGPPDRDNMLAPRYPTFSPDGEKIAFFQSDDTPLGDLWSISSLGGEAKRLTFTPSFAGGPIWTPDGRSLIYSAQRGDSRTLWKVELDDGTARPLLAGSGDDVEPHISSDGRQLIYTNSRNRFVLTETDLNSGDHRDIFETRHVLLAPELSPDKSIIAFFTYASIGGLQIFTVPLAGGSPSMITHEPELINAIPQWSADGKSIYFYQSGASNGFRKVSVTGGASNLVANEWRWDTHNAARVAPNERTIIYSKMDNGAPVSTILWDVINGSEKIFHAILEWPQWSRDGLRVTGAQFDEQRTFGDIAVCSVKVAKCEILATKAHIPTWSEDEKNIYFVREDNNYQHLWSVPADGRGKQTHIARLGPLYPTGPFYRVTPEETVIWVRFEKERNELWIADLSPDDP